MKAATTPLTNHKKNPQPRFNRNQQYSITALTDGGGTIVERYAYTAYGQVTILDTSLTQLATSAEGNRYTYTGREWDEGLSLYHYRARMHDAVGGRFVSRDPIGYYGKSYSLQQFAGGNPTVRVDPTGYHDHPPGPTEMWPYPTNNSEPPFAPDSWNDPDPVDFPDFDHCQYRNSCYSYACDNDNPELKPFQYPIPGGIPTPPFTYPQWPFWHNGHGPNDPEPKPQIDCEKLTAALIADGHKPHSCHEPCPCGTSRIMAVVNPDADYHFYRQDKGGCWSEKRGRGPVIKIGPDPRATPQGNYTEDCGCFCAPRHAI